MRALERSKLTITGTAKSLCEAARRAQSKTWGCVRVCACVVFPFILDMKFVGCTSRVHTGGRSHRTFYPPSFCDACLNFSRKNDSAIYFPRRP